MRCVFVYLQALVFYILMLCTLFLALPLLLIILPLPPMVSRRFGGAWAKINLYVLSITCGLKVKFVGTEYISKTPVLYVAKHQSALETLALSTVINNSTCVLKKSLFSIPIFGWFLWRSGMIGIDRSKGSQAIKKMRIDSLKAIEKGENVVIFPEGTRAKIGDAPNYKSGAYGMYKTLGIPVVPIALNTGMFWRRNTFIKTAGTATIQFLPPIPAGLSKAEFMQAIETEIETHTHILCKTP